MLTYSELKSMVCRIANYLKSLGVKRGSDVTMYMSLVPELPAAMVRTCIAWLCRSAVCRVSCGGVVRA